MEEDVSFEVRVIARKDGKILKETRFSDSETGYSLIDFIKQEVRVDYFPIEYFAKLRGYKKVGKND